MPFGFYESSVSRQLWRRYSSIEFWTSRHRGIAIAVWDGNGNPSPLVSLASSMAKTSCLWVSLQSIMTGMSQKVHSHHWTLLTHRSEGDFPFERRWRCNFTDKSQPQAKARTCSRKWVVTCKLAACYIKELKEARNSFQLTSDKRWCISPGCIDTDIFVLKWALSWCAYLCCSCSTGLSSCWPRCSKQQHFYWLHLRKMSPFPSRQEWITDVEHWTQFPTVL